MSVSLDILSAKEWAEISEDAHKIVFREKTKASLERIDYAILAVDDTKGPIGYATVRELDGTSVYLQYGGTMPDIRGTVQVFDIYQRMIDYFRTRYQRITTLVSNQNIAYLRLAFKVGFRVIGVRLFHGEVFCELLLEFSPAGQKG